VTRDDDDDYDDDYYDDDNNNNNLPYIIPGLCMFMSHIVITLVIGVVTPKLPCLR
jgi:hypothetical protein